MTKPFHAGNAARIGVTSAWLAKNGFSANTEIFDHENNFLETYGTGVRGYLRAETRWELRRAAATARLDT